MIVHRYIPFEDGDESFDTDKLMAALGEVMLRRQMSIDEALQLLLQEGMVPNAFLMAGGAGSILDESIRETENRINEILSKYDINKNKKDHEKKLNALQEKLQKKLGNISEEINVHDTDSLYKLKWSLSEKPQNTPVTVLVQKTLYLASELSDIKKALKKFDFHGKKKVPEEQLQGLLQMLSQLEQLLKALKEARNSGSFRNIDAQKFRNILGEEKYREFLETQKRILENLKKVLEEAGYAEREEEDGDLKITSRAIEYISQRAVSEIFQNLQSDETGVTATEEKGQGENVTSKNRPFQFGDNVYHVDWVNTLTNAKIKNRNISLQDMEVHESYGYAKNAIVILLDMSGSMFRFGRFYFAKKMILSLDRYIKLNYPNDRLEIIGFGSLAKRFSINELISLQPYPVLYRDPYIRLQFDLTGNDRENMQTFPHYFTNLQRGLSLSRDLLSSGETKNKQIFLVTDGVPTGHIEGKTLKLNYPPEEADFEAALKEAQKCKREGIIINTFLLSGEWWEDFSSGEGGEKFARRFVKAAGGRFYQSHPHELGVLVMYDFIAGRKKMIQWKDHSGASE